MEKKLTDTNDISDLFWSGKNESHNEFILSIKNIGYTFDISADKKIDFETNIPQYQIADHTVYYVPLRT